MWKCFHKLRNEIMHVSVIDLCFLFLVLEAEPSVFALSYIPSPFVILTQAPFGSLSCPGWGHAPTRLSHSPGSAQLPSPPFKSCIFRLKDFKSGSMSSNKPEIFILQMRKPVAHSVRFLRPFSLPHTTSSCFINHQKSSVVLLG